jgi:hypothetical protein
MAGEWECEELTRVLTTLATQIADLVPRGLQSLRPIVVGSAPSTGWLARLVEKYLAGRPGFVEYRQRTSFFLPRAPRLAQT